MLINSKEVLDYILKHPEIIFSIIALLISVFTAYKNRRSLSVTARFRDPTIYNKISNADLNLTKDFLTGPVDKKGEYYLITILISNNCPNPISIQNLAIHDQNGIKLNLVSYYSLQILNSDKSLPEKFGLFRSYAMPGEPYSIFNRFTPFMDEPIHLSPYESYLRDFAVYVEKSNPFIPTKFHVTCFTTIKNRFLVRKTKEILNKISTIPIFKFLYRGEHFFKVFNAKSLPNDFPKQLRAK